MTELNTITIEEKQYDVAALSETCIGKLNAYQTTQSAINLLASLLNHARIGADADFTEAKKLLPEPLDPPSSPEDTATH